MSGPPIPEITGPVPGGTEPPYQLSWEKNHPERAAWSAELFKLIGDNLSKFLSAKDITTVHPKFNSLTRAQQIIVLSEFFCQIAQYESSWREAVQVKDVNGSDDPAKMATGLFQMNEEDQEYFKSGTHYKYTDLKIAIPNIEAAVGIMLNQITQCGKIFIAKGDPSSWLFWATIHPGGVYDASVPITKVTSSIFNSSSLAAVPKPTPVVTLDTETNMLKVYAIAYKEKGISEVAGAQDNPRIIEYHKATNLEAEKVKLTDEVAWCASFVSWCLEQAGLKSTDDAWALSYKNYGTKLDIPTKGCICVFSRDGGNHVAFFDHQVGDDIYVLGGNQSNMVCIKAYPKSRLLAFRAY